MSKTTLYVTSAIIQGLDSKPWYFEEKCFWAFSIFFEKCSTIVHNLPWIYLGETKPEAMQALRNLKAKFHRKNIYNNNRVAILLDDSGIIAIGKVGHDAWLDVRDKFKSKPFNKLNIDFDSLIVECY